MPSHSLPRKMSIQLVHGATETAQNKATGTSTTYSKLLPGVETFSLPHMSPESELNMKYPERTGVGYRVDREDGTYSYQYFEPIPSSQRHFQTIKETKGGNLLTGHGTASDQGHADPLLGGGTGSLSFPRNQRENTHPTGTPKFCGDAGAARGTFSLNRGADFLHAPARLPATDAEAFISHACIFCCCIHHSPVSIHPPPRSLSPPLDTWSRQFNKLDTVGYNA